MPRKARYARPYSYQHFVSRFWDKQFRLADDEDRKTYLKLLDAAYEQIDATALSYALMSSHVHHGIAMGELPISRLFQPLHTQFAQAWHRRHGGLGPVFAARPTNWEISPENVARMIAYHHRNPVDADIVGNAAQSNWTSHRAYLRLEASPRWLDVERGLALCGFADTASGRRAFDEFVNEAKFDVEWTCSLRCNQIVSHGIASLEPRNSDASQLVQLAKEIAAKFDSPIDDILRHRRPTRAVRRRFVRAAIRQGYETYRIAKLLGIGCSAVRKLAQPRSQESQLED